MSTHRPMGDKTPSNRPTFGLGLTRQERARQGYFDSPTEKKKNEDLPIPLQLANASKGDRVPSTVPIKDTQERLVLTAQKTLEARKRLSESEVAKGVKNIDSAQTSENVINWKDMTEEQIKATQAVLEGSKYVTLQNESKVWKVGVDTAKQYVEASASLKPTEHMLKILSENANDGEVDIVWGPALEHEDKWVFVKEEDDVKPKILVEEIKVDSEGMSVNVKIVDKEKEELYISPEEKAELDFCVVNADPVATKAVLEDIERETEKIVKKTVKTVTKKKPIKKRKAVPKKKAKAKKATKVVTKRKTAKAVKKEDKDEK